ncbi:MAG: T9SS type A sorting domain-containing protein [Bacteroidetes bacterium]|nr:T9SS type A sorting domain-containing protein [Bacteroidota bacterium]
MRLLLSPISGDKTQANQGAWDYWIVRTNSTGVKIWDKRFGGLEDDFATCMDLTADGGYLIGGYSKSNPGGDKTEPCQGNWDYWVVKVNDQGGKVWDKTFGGNYTDWLFTMTKTSDGGFMLGGQSFSEVSGDKSEPNTDPTPAGSDRWMVKINSAGTKQWDRTFGGSEIEDISNVVQTADGGYLISGESYSPADGEKTEPNLGVEQTWVVKTDSIGVFEWDKTIFTYGHDEAGSALPFRDDCFIVVNFTQADTGGYVTEMSRGVGDYWMAKFCKDDPSSTIEIDALNNNWTLYPNPVEDLMVVKSKSLFPDLCTLEITDLNGRLLVSKQIVKSSSTDTAISLDVQNLPVGMYFCRIKDSKAFRTLKFIKIEY